jgi:hypothetical protein
MSLYRRDENGVHVDVDLVLIYLVTLVVVVVGAIKAIRWAVES